MDIEKKIEKRCESFKTLTKEECFAITLSARALSLDECMDYLLIDKECLTPDELSFSQQLHRHGRATGVKDACDKLFLHMSTKNGGQSSLEYLKQFSGDFAVEVSQASSSGFQFNVVIPEPGEKAAAKVSTGK